MTEKYFADPDEVRSMWYNHDNYAINFICKFHLIITSHDNYDNYEYYDNLTGMILLTIIIIIMAEGY